MSAAQTRQKMERMKLMPEDLALASASHAVHKARMPRTQRSAFDSPGQPAGPALTAHAPPNTQTTVTIHQTQAGAETAHPAHSAAAQAAARKTPSPMAPPPCAPLSRDHSHPAAPIITSV